MTQFPMIHTNGTALEALELEYKGAHRALVRAMLHFSQITFNERDYRTWGPDAFAKAKEDRERIAGCLKSADTYLSNHVEYLTDMKDRIEAAK